MKLKTTLFLIFTILISCDKEEITPGKNYSANISFDISEHLVPGEKVKQIEFIENGKFINIIGSANYTGQTLDIVTFTLNEGKVIPFAWVYNITESRMVENEVYKIQGKNQGGVESSGRT